MQMTLRFAVLILALLLTAPGSAKRYDPVEAVHATLVAFPAFHAEPEPETPEARSERLRVPARALWVASETRPKGFSRIRWAAVLMAVGKHETNFAKYVMEGRCSTGPRGKHECDSGRALGVFQVHRAACPEAWRLKPGTPEEILAGAKCAARLMRAAYYRCQGRAPTPLQGAFGGYGTGASCLLKSAAARERTAWQIAQRLGG